MSGFNQGNMPATQKGSVVPFAKMTHEEQRGITQMLFAELEEILHQKQPEKISALRVRMHEMYGMTFFKFQEHIEDLYNFQECHVGEDENDMQLRNLHLTSVPISFYPDHDIQNPITIQSTLGAKNPEWAQELLATMILHGFLRQEDQHWIVPGLFDIDELFATPVSAYEIITDLVSANLPEKFPLKNFTLTKEVPAKTLFFMFVTAPKDPEKPAIVPSIGSAFTDFNEMKLQMESIIQHYYGKCSRKEFEANVLVGPPLQGSVGTRLRYPATMMAHLSYYLMRIDQGIDANESTVVIERNRSTKSFNISVYASNTCLLSFKYADGQLALGLEEALMGYVLDTQGFSHYKIIDVDTDADLKEKIKRPLIRVVQSSN